MIQTPGYDYIRDYMVWRKRGHLLCRLNVSAWQHISKGKILFKL